MNEDGYLNGYAWSPNAGWLKFGGFSAEEVPNPSVAVNARIDNDGYLKGWARFVPTSSAERGGWDGWVRLHDSSVTSMGVRFDLTSGEVMDSDKYAWGSDTVAGWLDFSGVFMGMPPVSYSDVDLIVPTLSHRAVGDMDPVNGTYSNMQFPVVLMNVGEDSTPSDEDITWSVTIGDTVRTEVVDETRQSAEPGPLLGGGNVTVRPAVSDFIYGVYEVAAEVNHDTSIAETNYTNNSLTRTIPIRPPDPEIDISAERDIVRTGERATIAWDVTATYPMDCEVSGPGINYSFDPSIEGPTGERETTPRTNASIYTVTCNEPMTDTTFTSGQLRVEVVPQIREL